MVEQIEAMATKPQDNLAAVMHVLFLDGDCVFCQRSAVILHRIDRHDRLFFTTLQGETAQQLPEEWRRISNPQGGASGTAVLAENFGSTNVRFWRGADAPLRSLRIIGGMWSAFWLLSYCPKPIKDWVYQIIARNRHRLSGKNKTCTLPDEEFKARMLP